MGGDMRVVCPVCGFANPVVSSYKPGSILACRCEQHLEFMGDGKPVRVVPNQTSNDPETPGAQNRKLRTD
jgi:hypothetical protein